METSGQARLAAILKTPVEPPSVGLVQTPRTFRLGVVTVAAPLTVMFNNDPAAVVADVPSLSYLPVVGDMVVVAVFEGGGMVVLGTVSRGGEMPWSAPWGQIGGALDITPRGSSVGSASATVVFPAVNFVCVANRSLKVSWHASYVQNTDGGSNQVTVQFGGVGGVIQNAAVAVWAGGRIDPLDAFMFGASQSMFPPGPTLVQMLATATAPAGFLFQVGTYGSYLLVEDMGPAGPPP